MISERVAFKKSIQNRTVLFLWLWRRDPSGLGAGFGPEKS